MAASDADQAEPWQRIGVTEYRFEPPDIVMSRTRGMLSEQDVTAMFEYLRQRSAERRPLFWLHDNTHAPAPPPEARKRFAEELRRTPLDGMISYGSPFQIRILAKLAMQATQLLNPGDALPASFITASEAEGRAWIAQRRRELAK